MITPTRHTHPPFSTDNHCPRCNEIMDRVMADIKAQIQSRKKAWSPEAPKQSP